MGRERIIQSAVLGCAAILAASAWVSPAGACRIPAVMTNEMPNATEIVPRQHQRHTVATRDARPAANRQAQPAARAGGQRIDCRACIGMMPPLSSQDLMPLVPFADQTLRIHPIDPPADEVSPAKE